MGGGYDNPIPTHAVLPQPWIDQMYQWMEWTKGKGTLNCVLVMSFDVPGYGQQTNAVYPRVPRWAIENHAALCFSLMTKRDRAEVEALATQAGCR